MAGLNRNSIRDLLLDGCDTAGEPDPLVSPLFVAPGPSRESLRDSPRVLCEGPALLTFRIPLTYGVQ